QRDAAGHAGGHQVYECNHEHAVDGPGSGLRNLVGDIRYELDEESTIDRTRYVSQPADYAADEKRDRQKDREAVGRDELYRDGTQGTGYAGEHRRYAEGERLEHRVVHAHRLGRDRLFANGDDRPPDAATQQVACDG